MKAAYKLLLLLAGFSILVVSCRKSETEELNIDFGYDYYPLEIGLEYVYQVDSIIFREGLNQAVSDTSRAYLREVITDSLRDNTGQLLYRIERYWATSAEGPWQITKVMTAARTDRQALRTEDNLRFIKLVFPLQEGVHWDGNLFLPDSPIADERTNINDVFKEWDYQTVTVGLPETVGNQLYQEVATVQQADYDIAIEFRHAEEKYAKNVGLISREWQILDSQCIFCCDRDIGAACQSTPWEDRAENGFILRQQLLSFQKIN